MELAFKIDGELYEVKSLTLNDAVLIDREFGVQDITQFEWTRPAYLAALVYLGFRERNRHMSHDQLMEKVGGIDLADLASSIAEAVTEKIEAEASPTVAAPAAVDDKPKKKPAAKDV